MAAAPSINPDTGLAYSLVQFYAQNPDLLSIGDNGQIQGAAGNDATLQRLMANGSIGLGQGPNGNPQLTDFGNFQREGQQMLQGAKPGTAVIDTNNPYNAVVGAVGGPSSGFVPEGVNVTSWGGQATPLGAPNAAGMQMMDASSMRPASYQMPDKFGEMFYNLAPLLLSAPLTMGLTAPGMLSGGALSGLGMGADLGNLGSALFRGAGNAVEGQGFNPMSLLGPLAQQFGLPGWAGQLGNLGVNLARGGGVNPMGIGMTLGRLGLNNLLGGGA